MSLCLNKRMTDSLLNLLPCAHSEFTSCQLLASLTASPSQMQSLRQSDAKPPPLGSALTN